MAVITLSGLTFFENGKSPATSDVVGYENSQTRVVRYTFKAPSEGASHVKFTIANITKQSGFTDVAVEESLRFYIGTSSTDHANGGAGSAYTGAVTVKQEWYDYYSANGEADILLLPDETYYLWIFPATTKYGWFYWYPETETIEPSGSAGIVEISTGSGFVKAIPYIDNGSGWDVAPAYVDNGSAFKICV
jgi:hypothetical protein